MCYTKHKGSVTTRVLCLAVDERTDACKTRGEVARGVTWGHREVRAGQGVAHGGGDGHRRWCNALSSCAHPFLLPPPSCEAEAQTSQPMLCQEALLGAYGAVTCAQLFVTLPHLTGRIHAETAGAVDKRSDCRITIDGPAALHSDGGRLRLE